MTLLLELAVAKQRTVEEKGDAAVGKFSEGFDVH